jgi:hypothetical protein
MQLPQFSKGYQDLTTSGSPIHIKPTCKATDSSAVVQCALLRPHCSGGGGEEGVHMQLPQFSKGYQALSTSRSPIHIKATCKATDSSAVVCCAFLGLTAQGGGVVAGLFSTKTKTAVVHFQSLSSSRAVTYYHSFYAVCQEYGLVDTLSNGR